MKEEMMKKLSYVYLILILIYTIADLRLVSLLYLDLFYGLYLDPFHGALPLIAILFMLIAFFTAWKLKITKAALSGLLVNILNILICIFNSYFDFDYLYIHLDYLGIYPYLFLISVAGLFIIDVIWLINIKAYKQVKKAKRKVEKIERKAEIDASRLEKLSKLMKISDKIKIDDISDVLEMKRKVLLDQLIDWSDKLEFKLDGDYLIINQSSVDDFINALDQQFSTWERREDSREGKI